MGEPVRRGALQLAVSDVRPDAADGPVAYGRPYRQWFVFGYDEVHEVLRSPHTATAPVGELLLSTSRYRKLSPSARSNFSRWLLVNDAPDHTRLRAAVGRAFTPRQIDRYEPLIGQVVGELVDTLDTTREIDIVDAFTSRLPIEAIAAVLGLPADRRAWLLRASREIGGMLEPLTPFDPASMSRPLRRAGQLLPGRDRATARRPGARSDLRSRRTEDEQALDDDEIVAMVAFLLFAGHETVTGMLGNALVALARHPDQRALLRDRPDLIANAVEELLRFDPPVQVSGRQATADLTVAGVTIERGDNIGLMIGAANRDKRRWRDADELRLDRPDPKPISFGFGAHHCLGAALARMELRLAIPALLDALGDYTVDLDERPGSDPSRCADPPCSRCSPGLPPALPARGGSTPCGHPCSSVHVMFTDGGAGWPYRWRMAGSAGQLAAARLCAGAARPACAAGRGGDELVTNRVVVDGRTVSYASGGHGLPVLFLHGWGLDHESYRRALRRLTARGCNVIAPSLPGFGRSDELPVLQRTLVGYAGWVERFLQAIGVDEPVVVLGHSFGGGIATRFAHDRPERVRYLVMLNAVGDAQSFAAGGRHGRADRIGLDGVRSLLDALRPTDDLATIGQMQRTLLANLQPPPVHRAAGRAGRAHRRSAHGDGRARCSRAPGADPVERRRPADPACRVRHVLLDVRHRRPRGARRALLAAGQPRRLRRGARQRHPRRRA